jgi:hypothetical protein
MAVIRRLPGRARPREEVLREYQESNAKVRRNIPAVLWDFVAPDPDQFYRWRVQLDCGCIKELLTSDKEKLPTESRYRCDHLYHSQLQPGQVGCFNDEHTRPQPYREIVEWGERREQRFPADPVESRDDDIDQELWAKIRHDAPHTSAFWIVTLSCGHRSEVCTDVDWKPEAGPRHASPERVQEMIEDFEEYWASHPGAEHERERSTTGACWHKVGPDLGQRRCASSAAGSGRSLPANVWDGSSRDRSQDQARPNNHPRRACSVVSARQSNRPRSYENSSPNSTRSTTRMKGQA